MKAVMVWLWGQWGPAGSDRGRSAVQAQLRNKTQTQIFMLQFSKKQISQTTRLGTKSPPIGPAPPLPPLEGAVVVMRRGERVGLSYSLCFCFSAPAFQLPCW
jgi:hypothetical protein